MSREIKFRGFYKFNDHAEWVYGYYYHAKSIDQHGIYLGEKGSRNVDGKSVGQYTGLKDKNGKEIYEGDICHTYTIGIGNLNEMVVFKDGSFCFSHPFNLTTELRGFKTDYIEVIGNVFEHPELISKEAVKS